jgi:putative glutamine amidotransferase
VSDKKIIGITDCEKYSNYEKWMQAEGVETIKLGYAQSNFNDIKKCNGILLTGGEDVHPRFYNRPDYVSLCDDDMDEERDEFELMVIEHAQQNSLPLLGICRGLQIANVYFGGTLIPDLPTHGKFNHSKFKEGNDRYHQVTVDENSFLFRIAKESSGEINSAHHQSADRIGEGLVANAISVDGVVEGIERKKTEGKPFLLLVQWHPERMKNQESVFVKNIRDAFLNSI